MCGILGCLLDARASMNKGHLATAMGQMEHRGPDGEGVEELVTPAGQTLVLGHKRLSIIDLAGGVQPFWSHDRRFVCTFNGEIYNYIELREELVARGVPFTSHSDTEVLIEAIRAWGDAALSRFRGMFAFALYDTLNDDLLLARDPFGKKPLFLAHTESGLFFASEIAPLLTLSAIPVEFDHSEFAGFLRRRYVYSPKTMFKGVEKLPSGHGLRVRGGQVEQWPYYVLPFIQNKPVAQDYRGAVREFSRILDEAVHIRMRSDVPFGAYLSGGLDSSVIVALMTQHSNKPVATFAVGFDDTEFSELDYAAEVSSALKTAHTELKISPDMFVECWENAVSKRGAPVSQSSDIPILLLSERAGQDVKVVLTGEGADELLGGYPKYRAEAWVSLYQNWIPSWLHRAVVRPVGARLPYQYDRIKTMFAALEERDIARRADAWFGSMDENEIRRLVPESVVNPFAIDPAWKGMSSARQLQIMDQLHWLPDNLLERGDRMLMAASVEGRMPFMDTELAAFVSRLPESYYLGGKGGKRILRDAAAQWIDHKSIVRPKNGFKVPFGDWLHGPLRDRLKDLLLSDQSVCARIMDKAMINVFVSDHLERRSNREKALWSLMNFEIFARQAGF